MGILEKIARWFQVAASSLFVLFSLFNLIRTFTKGYGSFYAMCFAAMLYLSWKLLRLSVTELRGLKRKGGE